MKNVLKKLVLLTVPFFAISCSGNGGSSVADNSNGNSGNANTSSNNGANSSSNTPSSSIIPHSHSWASEWSNDASDHWHACSGCNEKKDSAAHTYGEWQTSNLGTLLNDERFNLSTVKYRACSVCGFEQLDNNQAVLPEIRFNFEQTYTDKNGNTVQQEMDFATKARSTDTTRPTVAGKITIANAGDYNTKSGKELDVEAFKVRGNQTAGFDKKGFQIKFDKKQNLLGLNAAPDGKGYKKWVLLADAKDTTISRTALGLSLSKGVIAADSNVWSTNFTPVSVYLNDQYWGMYMLAEQKEVKDGRIKLHEAEDVPVLDGEGNPVIDPETGKEVKQSTVEIGYSFELDYYAKNEPAKGADGDPTFEIGYGNYFTQNDYKIESCLANSGLGLVKTYTMNSDIIDSTAGENEHLSYNGSGTAKSEQLKFIRNRLQALFNVLGEASKNKVAKDIDANNNVVSTSLSVRQTIEKNFDLNAWAEGFVINAVCLPPDVGYSSFYLSYNNEPEGDHRLRFDNPWDFDSNFGNRRNFIEKPDEVSQSSGWGAQSFDPYFMDRTANPWLNLLGKFDWFINDYVKPKWNAVRENKTFEKMLGMLNVYYKYYDGEYAKNFTKWPTTQASDQNVASYFNGDGVNSGELRKPFVNVNERKQAQQETINWLTKRVNYLEKKWGNNRPSVTAE